MHRLDLPLDPSSPSRARHFVRGVLGEWDIETDLTEDAALLVTELVTNALIHARTAVVVAISRGDSSMDFAVTDRGPGVVRMETPGPDSVTGRGIFLLDQLASDWGVTTADGPSKTVRFSLPVARHAGSRTAW